ncbi:MAG: hypothetical protein JW828_12645 [Sedimentisphaerales bacterium]|nr:hypothetical protein [Sedimentisphaerales bacterium]
MKRVINIQEVLVVLVFVVFALMVFLPAAGTARQHSKATLCLANQRILSQAWLAYQEEYDGRLVGGSNYYSGGRSTPYRWVERPLYKPDDNPEFDPMPTDNELTLEYHLNGIKAGELFPYIGNTSVYHCPADDGWLSRESPNTVYLSYRISGTMNGEDFGWRDGWPGKIMGYRTITLPYGSSRPLICAEQYTQIKSPSQKWVFSSEDDPGLSMAGGSLILMASDNFWSWWDCPAGFHNGQATFGFADGHAETHRWRDVRTLYLIRRYDNMGNNYYTINHPDSPDLLWMNIGYLVAE